MKKRVLFLYLTKHSGHYAAAVAIEEAMRRMDDSVETMFLDSFSHGNPVLSKVALRTYLTILKTAPEVWEYLYDNPGVMERTKKIRSLLNRGNSKKLQRILKEFEPDAIVCTQAFACGVTASWKRSLEVNSPILVGVLTDFVAHRYWADDQVDLYITPNEETQETLLMQGIPPERVKPFGLPVRDIFRHPINKSAVAQSLGLTPNLPKILVMGGSLGLGPMKSVIRKLDKLPQPFDMVVVTGKNYELMRKLQNREMKLRHPTKILGYVENTNELMGISDFVITKPGGITTAEALSKNLPIIIINPIPGQEAKNTEFLLSHGVALETSDTNDVMITVDEFLRNPATLRQMREATYSLSKPDAAVHTAEEVLRLLALKEEVVV